MKKLFYLLPLFLFLLPLFAQETSVETFRKVISTGTFSASVSVSTATFGEKKEYSKTIVRFIYIDNTVVEVTVNGEFSLKAYMENKDKLTFIDKDKKEKPISMKNLKGVSAVYKK